MQNSASLAGQVAVVTGANRGLGFEVSRQLARHGARVLMTARDARKGSAAADALAREQLPVIFHELDVTSDASVRALFGFVRSELGRLDVLINNAGIMPDDNTDSEEGGAGASATIERMRQAMETNVYGAYRMIEGALPLMRARKYGRIVNVSSGMGQLGEMEGGYPAYRISKTALNAVTRIITAENSDWDLQVNSVCPGWVKTDMGGAEAEREPVEGVDTMVWLASQAASGPRGGFFRDREPLAW